MVDEFTVRELDYQLPDHLVAQEPLPNRDDARLLVVTRSRNAMPAKAPAAPIGPGHDLTRTPMADRRITDLPSILSAGDLLVLNDTRVIPARFFTRRRTGGGIEGLFVHDRGDGTWEVLLRGATRLRVGEVLKIVLHEQVELTVLERLGAGAWCVRVDPPMPALQLLERFGHPPLPPYIHRPRRAPRQADEEATERRDRERYQTVYAARPGAVAAPTAGLHFTKRIFAELLHAGVRTTQVTLHVGPGTFAPITADRLADHGMHREWLQLSDDAVQAVAACRGEGSRVIAVGTTALRVLESCATSDGVVRAHTGWTDLFIYPPYDFRVADGLLTNFHLPRSTLLALVMAFGGVERLRTAYRHAIESAYRFYSYGDAMLLV